MKKLIDERMTAFEINMSVLQTELMDFKTFLAQKEELAEKKDIEPFFKSRLHLSGFIAQIGTSFFPNYLKFNYNVFGYFEADLVLANDHLNQYLFVEFENATSKSLFSYTENRQIQTWGTGVDKGFNQIIDWFWSHDDQKDGKNFRLFFGNDFPELSGIVLAGRNKNLNALEQSRIKWRQDNLLINNKKIYILTYDDLYEVLNRKYHSLINIFQNE